MIRVAGERIAELFALAEAESRTRPASPYPKRYVVLARRIGMRYTVRLPIEYRERYCQSCSAFWVEGRTVRTRLRAGLRVRTCTLCGATRRQRYRGGRAPRPAGWPALPPTAQPGEVLAGSSEEEDRLDGSPEDEDE
jgi:RNase P subunit RPR2